MNEVRQAARVARIADVPGYGAEGQATWHALRAELGIEAFGVGAYTATAAGQQLVSEHDESIRGDARFPDAP